MSVANAMSHACHQLFVLDLDEGRFQTVPPFHPSLRRLITIKRATIGLVQIGKQSNPSRSSLASLCLLADILLRLKVFRYGSDWGSIGFNSARNRGYIHRS